MGGEPARQTSPDASTVTARRRGNIICPLNIYRSPSVTVTVMALIFFVQTTLVFDCCNIMSEPNTEPTSSPPTLEPTAQCTWTTKEKCKKFEECAWNDNLEQCFVRPDETPEPTSSPSTLESTA